MRIFNKYNFDKLTKEFEELERENKFKLEKHNVDFEKLEKNTRIHQNRVKSRLNRFIPSRNR